jgi:hypothetical protein
MEEQGQKKMARRRRRPASQNGEALLVSGVG